MDKKEKKQAEVLVIEHPDVWPLRAEGLMDALTGIINVLEISQPLVKTMQKKDPLMFEIIKTIHHETLAAMAFVSVRRKSVEDIIKRNNKGEYFERYLKGISKETLKEWDKMGLKTGIYSALNT